MTDIAAVGIPIDRQSPSVVAMFQTVINSISERERLSVMAKAPTIMAEIAFRQARTTQRFRYVLDHVESCRIIILVVLGWLRLLENW